jgi:S1-C subfamily serine protease
MRYLALFVCLLFSSVSYSQESQEYRPMLPVDSIESSMLSVERKVRAAAVKVTAPFNGGHGSGSYIKYKDLHIVITAQHVASGKLGENYIVSHKGESHISMLIYSDDKEDIAVLYVKTPFRNTSPMPWKPQEKTATVGTNIIYSGFPSDHKLMSFRGQVAGHENGPGIGKHIILQTYGWFGCSGSVVYDTKGNVVGVLYGVDVEYYPNVQVQENLIWVAPINKMPIRNALKKMCDGWHGEKRPKACK